MVPEETLFDGYSTSIVIAWCREQFYYNSMLLNMSVLCPNHNLFPKDPPHQLMLHAIMRIVPRIRKYMLRGYRLLQIIEARRDPSEPEHYVRIDVSYPRPILVN